MAQANPNNGEKWKDRYGIAYGKGLKKVGNVESHLSYSKLHRTGKLLRGLYAKRQGNDVILGNRVRYAKDHNEGMPGTKSKVVKAPYVQNGANAVRLGGDVVARPFMLPSKKVQRMPMTLLSRKLRSFGWNE